MEKKLGTIIAIGQKFEQFFWVHAITSSTESNQSHGICVNLCVYLNGAAV